MRPSDNFSVADIEYANKVDPLGISTWSNAVDGLGKYREKGGKVLTFHGTRDPVRNLIWPSVPQRLLILVFP